MNPVIIGNATLYCGDSLEVLKSLPENSIEACLTDPPYGLSNHTEADIRACMSAWLAGKPYQHGKAGFMGRDWDSFVPGPELWRELYRVLKPGAHLLVFAGTRTADLMGLALRLAGFECRENLLWVYGSGFPKSLCVSKAIDAHFGKEREVIKSVFRGNNAGRSSGILGESVIRVDNITTPASPEAAQWDGWKSSLKPCYEPILLFRKPLDGTIAETVLKWGTGGLNVGACRIDYQGEIPNLGGRATAKMGGEGYGFKVEGRPTEANQQGRYPGNLIVSSDEEVERCFPVTNGGAYKIGGTPRKTEGHICTGSPDRSNSIMNYGDSGSASRFFQHCDFTIDEIAEMNGIELKRIVYSGKAGRRDRNEGCDELEIKNPWDRNSVSRALEGMGSLSGPRHNHHPTCKPSSLLRYLLKLIVPPGATVIDPFFGSGSTGKAALLEGFNVIGIEREPEYFEIAQARVAHVSPEAFTAFTIKVAPRIEAAQRQTRMEFDLEAAA